MRPGDPGRDSCYEGISRRRASGQLIYKQEPGLVFEPKVRWHSRVMVTVFCTWAGARQSTLHKLESEELLQASAKVTLCCQSQLSTSSTDHGWLSCLAFDLSVGDRYIIQNLLDRIKKVFYDTARLQVYFNYA